MKLRSFRSLAPVLLGVVLSSALAAPAAAAEDADPFYLNLLRDGAQSLARGESERAVAELRLACFGLLERPPLLGECLVRLALAQAALDERDEFQATFRRLEEVEERFQGYAEAELETSARAAFEARALEWIAPDVLRSIPRFAALAARREAETLDQLPEGKRLQELERRAAEEPGEPRWKVRLAELELGRKKPQAALGRLEGLPGGAEAGAVACLRGRALAALDRCAEAVASFALCPAAATEPAALEAHLGCLVDQKRWPEARTLLAGLPKPLAERPAVAKLARKVPRSDAAKVEPAPVPKPPAAKPAEPKEPGSRRPASGGRAAAKPAAEPARATPQPTVAPPAVSTPAGGAAPAVAAAGPSPLDAETARRVEEARSLLRAARRSAELEQALALAKPIADAHRERAELQHLVGEIAYRASRWAEAADYYRRGGAAGPADPTQRFYMAVSLYETGDRAGARAIAAVGLDQLPRNAFVDGYLRRIAASGNSSP